MHKIGVNINQIAKKVNSTGDLYPEEKQELKEMVKELWRILRSSPIKVTDKKALDYITNPDKTDEKLLVSSFGCSPETADLEFSMTREMAKKNGMDKGDNLAFHLIQSFKPGEVDAETAHRLGQQFADEVLKGKYEYVISTHVDKNHIHNHIIFNAASFVDHHKYVSNKRSYHKICRISNRICQKMDLPPVCQPEKKAKVIRRTWNIIVAPAGKPSYVLQLIKQSGLPSTMRNFYKKCS
jgi:Bacterial mobilisation protein (MobC)./Relaxase/Mobilisation nuclease domain.